MHSPIANGSTPPLDVGLLVTCVVDLFRPSVGDAAVTLLEAGGCRVHVPVQTCCGQPAFNSGDVPDARQLARNVVAAFEGFDYVVIPSGSCGGMVKLHYPELFEPDDPWLRRAEALATKTFELVTFLTDVLGWDRVDARFDGVVTYHDSCSGLRELGIAAQPRRLLASVRGLDLVEMADTETCCGFGGTFCVKYGEISDAMVTRKAEAAEATGAATLLAGDVSCLLNIAGKLKRRGSPIECRHVVEVLAGMTGAPGIGETRS
jgi:L-lactate dehydrogenase complex protein LldE